MQLQFINCNKIERLRSCSCRSVTHELLRGCSREFVKVKAKFTARAGKLSQKAMTNESANQKVHLQSIQINSCIIKRCFPSSLAPNIIFLIKPRACWRRPSSCGAIAAPANWAPDPFSFSFFDSFCFYFID